MFNRTSIAIFVAVVVGAASAANAKGQDPRRDQAGAARVSSRMPIEPYGTGADIQRCVANMEASLPHGHSILGSRDTAIYIQDRGNLDDMGFTEYDVMVGRCMDKSYHRFISLKERQPRKWRRLKNLRRARPETTHTDFVRVSRARCNMAPSRLYAGCQWNKLRPNSVL